MSDIWPLMICFVIIVAFVCAAEWWESRDR